MLSSQRVKLQQVKFERIIPKNIIKSKIEIILVDIGCFQEYILDNITNLQRFNNTFITVITEPNLFHEFDDIININLVDSTSIYTYNYQNTSKIHDAKFRDNFWFNCSMRLFLLYGYIKATNARKVIHIENDVMLYENMDIFLESFEKINKFILPIDSNYRCIPGIMYIPDYRHMTSLIEKYDVSKNDMENLGKYFFANRSRVESFPLITVPGMIISNTNSTNNTSKVITGNTEIIFDTDTKIKDDTENILTKNFDYFGSIFDAAAIGQYLFGIDPRNSADDTHGYINDSCIVNYSNFKFVWKKNDVDNMYRPYIIIHDKYIQIINIHVHCKKLYMVSGINPEDNTIIKLSEDNKN